jgi:hypothetical protein
MRDLVVVAAAVCAASGFVLAVMPTLENKSHHWLGGFCAGCLTASVVWVLAAAALAFV